MKLVAVLPYYKPAYSFGGPIACNADLLESLVRLGLRVTVLTTNADGRESLDVPVGTGVDVNGVEVHYFRRVKVPQASFFYSPELGGACRSSFADADYGYFGATWTYPMLPAARAAWNNRVPYIVCPHGSFMRWSMRQKRLKKALYMSLLERRFTNRASAIQCTTDLERQQTAQLGLRPPLIIVPNGLNVERFAGLPARGPLRNQLGLASSDLLSVFVGRLHSMKRVDLIIAAFAKVATALPGAHLAIAGPDDGEEIRLRKLLSELGLERRVTFLGLLTGNDLLQLYSDADLLTLLSWRENFGMVVLEAMAAGLPVLVGTEVGLANEVSAAHAGRVVGSGPDEIAAAWTELLTHSELRNGCGERARRLIQSSFSTEAVAKRMLAVLQEMGSYRHPQVHH